MNNDKLITANNENIIHIVAAANDFYVPYLSVLIRSVIKFSNDDIHYNFTVMNTDITERHQTVLKEMALEKDNFEISFINVKSEMKDYQKLFISNHIKIETYFRLLLPKLMPDVHKVLYMDCDVIANTDVSELYSTDVNGYYLAGTRDADSAANCNTNSEYCEYVDETLLLPNHYDYLQAGIIVMNLDEFRNSCDTDKLLKIAMSRKWTFHDQDVLNFCCKGKIKFIDYAWNFVYDYDENFRRSTNVIVNAPHYIFSDYMRAKKSPKIIHFSWTNKPWFSPGVHFGEKFWSIARETPFYTETLVRMERDLGNYFINTQKVDIDKVEEFFEHESF